MFDNRTVFSLCLIDLQDRLFSMQRASLESCIFFSFFLYQPFLSLWHRSSSRLLWSFDHIVNCLCRAIQILTLRKVVYNFSTIFPHLYISYSLYLWETQPLYDSHFFTSHLADQLHVNLITFKMLLQLLLYYNQLLFFSLLLLLSQLLWEVFLKLKWAVDVHPQNLQLHQWNKLLHSFPSHSKLTSKAFVLLLHLMRSAAECLLPILIQQKGLRFFCVVMTTCAASLHALTFSALKNATLAEV